jgi:hypothetical protein
MYMGMRRIRMTRRGKRVLHRIDLELKRVILEVVFHSAPITTAKRWGQPSSIRSLRTGRDRFGETIV